MPKLLEVFQTERALPTPLTETVRFLDTQERPYACRYCDRRYSRRDLATRHEKTLHVDQYVAPNRRQQQSPLTGPQTLSPDSPPSGSAASPSLTWVVADVESQASTAAASQPTQDISESEAWTVLLGLGGFDPFSYDGSLNEFPFFAPSAADAFPLATTNLSMPIEPSIPDQTPHPASDIDTQTTLEDNGPWIAPSPATELCENIPQPWRPPPLPSVGPEVSPVRISDAVISSLRSSLGPEDRKTPTPAAFRLFFGTYFDVFNVHMPLLHAPSFDFETQPQGLLLAMAAVGALYRLERRAVCHLYRAADAAAPVGAGRIQIGSFDRGTGGTSAEPSSSGKWHSLAYYQTRLILQCVGILGGNSDLAERSLGMIAELSLTLYRTLARQLKASASVRDEDLTWVGWLDRECTKRTLYGVWNLSDFAASTYGIAPPLTVGHDGELELPCSEALWQARNEAEWNGARAAEADSPAMTVREACFLIADQTDRGPPLTSSPQGTALRWSPFAIVCIMHIFSTRLWHVSHETLSSAATTRPGGPTPAHELDARFRAAVRQGAGRRCHDLIRACAERAERDRTPRCTRDARWQLADAADVLRVCYARSVPALARLDCDTLLRGGEDDVRAAVREHVAAPLGRCAEFTLAAAVALDGLCVPLRYGTQFYRKSGALNGSLEHLVAGWDNDVVSGAQALGIELDNDERELLRSIYAMLREAETEPHDSSPLAARLLRYWASFYEYTWVWGVAPRMAVVLRKLASGYEFSQG
ncbi:hypothetical protein LA080_012730 [Diaporthe eres]|nr:hypothetical protein LA080_012730 [Diaporthe eres]